ncbi:hypothetical protein AB0M44_20665 [Streptosporangium subroseum]
MIRAGWNATHVPASGTVTAQNVSHSGSVPAGGSAALNGATCGMACGMA